MINLILPGTLYVVVLDKDYDKSHIVIGIQILVIRKNINV